MPLQLISMPGSVHYLSILHNRRIPINILEPFRIAAMRLHIFLLEVLIQIVHCHDGLALSGMVAASSYQFSVTCTLEAADLLQVRLIFNRYLVSRVEMLEAKGRRSGKEAGRQEMVRFEMFHRDVVVLQVTLSLQL